MSSGITDHGDYYTDERCPRTKFMKPGKANLGVIFVGLPAELAEKLKQAEMKREQEAEPEAESEREPGMVRVAHTVKTEDGNVVTVWSEVPRESLRDPLPFVRPDRPRRKVPTRRLPWPLSVFVRRRRRRPKRSRPTGRRRGRWRFWRAEDDSRVT